MDEGAHLILDDLILTNYIYHDYFQIRSQSGVRTLTYEFGGHIVQQITPGSSHLALNYVLILKYILGVKYEVYNEMQISNKISSHNSHAQLEYWEGYIN